jgi:hypothetical protein
LDSAVEDEDCSLGSIFQACSLCDAETDGAKARLLKAQQAAARDLAKERIDRIINTTIGQAESPGQVPEAEETEAAAASEEKSCLRPSYN